MNDYITKPVDPKALTDIIEKWLKKNFIKTNFNNISDITETNMKNSKIEEPHDLFDKNIFMSNMMDDEDLAKVIVDSFLEDYPKQIELLTQAGKSGDFKTAERTAHTIKGIAATLGSEAIKSLALKMEKAAADKNLDFVSEKISSLTSYLNLLEQKLKELLV